MQLVSLQGKRHVGVLILTLVPLSSLPVSVTSVMLSVIHSGGTSEVRKSLFQTVASTT